MGAQREPAGLGRARIAAVILRVFSCGLAALFGIGFAAILCCGFGGCWAAAFQLVPLGAKAVSGLSNGAMNLASNSGASHDLHPGEDEADRHERCDNLAEAAPGVIELRSIDGAAPQWRELAIRNETGAPHWTVVADTDGSAQWRPARNLGAMHFTPPLGLSRGATYLGYAPAEPQDSAEQDKLTGLTANFGASNGTFLWNNRTYQYVLSARLPCFPPPVVMK